MAFSTARSLLAAVLVGIVLYLFTFAFVVDKPLTTAEIGDYVTYKERYLASIAPRRKIVILAGSNGRYSHRCESVTEVTGIPCANLSTAAGLDLDWQMSRYLRYLGSGDVLYMPLEYWSKPASATRVGAEAPFVVRHDHNALSRYSARQLVGALFYFDVRYFFSALGEMMLSRAGVQRRTSVRNLTVQGDERGASAAKASAYRSFIQGLPAPTVSPTSYDDPTANAPVAKVLDDVRARGVIVVGGLATTFDDTRIPTEVIARLKALFELHGGCFLVLPNLSLYPRRMFFDTEYHLQEDAQIAHSRIVAPYLARIWQRRSCVTQ